MYMYIHIYIYMCRLGCVCMYKIAYINFAIGRARITEFCCGDIRWWKDGGGGGVEWLRGVGVE